MLHSSFSGLTSQSALYQAAAVWKTLAHPNIVPFLGVIDDPPQLISDWMSCGDMIEYIANHPYTVRRRLVCTSSPMLRDGALTPPSAI